MYSMSTLARWKDCPLAWSLTKAHVWINKRAVSAGSRWFKSTRLSSHLTSMQKTRGTMTRRIRRIRRKKTLSTAARSFLPSFYMKRYRQELKPLHQTKYYVDFGHFRQSGQGVSTYLCVQHQIWASSEKQGMKRLSETRCSLWPPCSPVAWGPFTGFTPGTTTSAFTASEQQAFPQLTHCTCQRVYCCCGWQITTRQLIQLYTHTQLWLTVRHFLERYRRRHQATDLTLSRFPLMGVRQCVRNTLFLFVLGCRPKQEDPKVHTENVPA